MKRGDLYLVRRPDRRDPRRQRVFVVVGRQTVIESNFSTILCAPIYSRYDGLSTQVPLGPREGLKHDSSVHCDALMSLPKATLRDYVGTLSERKLRELGVALAIAVGIA